MVWFIACILIHVVHVLASTTDPAGTVTVNTYDPTTGDLATTEVKDAAGNVLQVTRYEHDSKGNQTASIDHFGTRQETDYNGKGWVVETRTETADGTLLEKGTFEHDGHGNQVKSHQWKPNALGAWEKYLTTEFTYDDLNRLLTTTQVLDALDATKNVVTQTVYTANGQVDQAIDARGTVTKHAYDLSGRLTSTTHALATLDAASESFTYDLNDNIATQTDRGGHITEHTYDKVNRVKQVRRAKATADEADTYTTYDYQGRVKTQTDALGNVTTYTYDGAGRRIKVAPPGTTGTIRSFYDRAGRQVKTLDHLTRQTLFTYDALGRQTTVTHHDNTTSATAYDALGRRTASTDQAGVTTQYGYDALGRLTKVTQPMVADPLTGQLTNPVTSYGYDALGRQVSQTDAKGNATAYEYDQLGRRTKRTLPGGGAGNYETYEYDKNGNATKRTDFTGLGITRYEHDVHNRLRKKLIGASLLPTVEFTYTAAGQRATMTDPSGATTYTYDNLDRLKSKATPNGTLSYTYDDQGNLLTTSSGNASGVSVTYEYDTLNRLKKATDNNLAVGSNATNYTYDGVGNLASVAYPNSVTHAYVHNNLNRLTDLSVTGPPGTIASYGYTLGPAGNRAQVNEGSGRQVRYSYDNLYRLTIESVLSDPAGINGTAGYTHDLVGNRTRRQSTLSNVPTSAHLYDSRDRMDTLTGYSYDANGNTTASPNPGGGANTDTYDFEDRLVGRTRIGTTIAIAYDGDGNRVSKTVNGVVTKYLVDTNNLTGYAQVLEELNGSNVVQKRYTYGSDLISQTIVSTSATSYYCYDGHGSVRELTSSAGAVTDTYDYDAFGILTHSTGSTSNLYLYAGEQWDPDLGMYYNRARLYNVAIARFQTADQYEGSSNDPRTLHKYLYANADPVQNTDPSGFVSAFEQGGVVTIQNALFTIGIGVGVSTFAFNLQDHGIEYAVKALIVDTAAGVVISTGVGAALYVGGKATAVAFRTLRPLATKTATETVQAATAVSKGTTFEALQRIDISDAGSTRKAHRTVGNKSLAKALENDPELQQGYNQMFGTDVLAHMKSGKGALKNPPDTEWHHMSDDPDVLILLRREVHRAPEFQAILHGGGRGGYRNFYAGQ